MDDLAADTVDSRDVPPRHSAREQRTSTVGALAETLSSTPRSPLWLHAGEPVERYQILEKIGQGGMGVVYSAYDPQLDRRVALKLVLGVTPDHASTQRLLREAQALARLSHPNVVSVHDAGVAHGHLFIAMEFIEGQTLSAWREGARSLEERLSVLTAAGRGLAAAHAAGLLHRDFKPDNVMVGVDGRVRVMDFGLAREVADEEPLKRPAGPSGGGALALSLTQTGTMMGTPAYMSPEQFTGVCDPRSDQYSFFIVVYETLFGRRPIEAETLEELVRKVSRKEAITIPNDEQVPPSIRAAIAQGLATDPEQRFVDMAAALTGLALDTRGGRAWAAPALGALALAGLVGLAAWPQLAEAEDPCAAATLAAQRSWDEQARESVRTSFRALEAPFALSMGEQAIAALDEVGRGHAQLRREICEATRVESTQSEALLDLRMDCLDSRRRRFESLISVFGAATVDTAAKALDAIDQLPSAQECAHLSLEREHAPPSIEHRAEVDRVQRLIARASAEGTAGATNRALELLEAETQTVENIAYRPLDAEFYFELGRWRADTTGVGAEAPLFRALSESVILGDEANILSSLFLLIPKAMESDRAVEADHWLTLFRSYTTRRGGRLEDRLRLEELLGYQCLKTGDRTEGTQHIERALELQRELDPTNALRLVELHKNAGLSYLVAGDFERAEHHFGRAHELNIDLFGIEHPLSARTLSDLASVATRRGDHEAAIRLHEEALRSFEKAYGPDNAWLAGSYLEFALTLTHIGDFDRSEEFYKKTLRLVEGKPEMVTLYHDTLANYGVTLWFAGRYEEALPLQEDDLRIQRSRPLVFPVDLGTAEGNLASTLASLGRHEESLELHRSALARFEATLSADDPTIAVALLDMSTPLIALGHQEEAIVGLERAESYYAERVDSTDPYALAEVRVVMVEALRPSVSAAHRERAASLAAGVHAVAPSLGPSGEELVRRLEAAGVRSSAPPPQPH